MVEGRLYIVVAEETGDDSRPVAVCRDPALIRLALLRSRDDLERRVANHAAAGPGASEEFRVGGS